MKSVAVNRNSRYSHSMWVQRPWQEIMYTTESDMTASLPRSLGIHFYATNGGSCTYMGMPPTREKGSHLPPRTTKLCNLRNGCDSITAPTVNQIQDSLLGMKDDVMLSPPRDARNVMVLPHLVGLHKYTRLRVGLAPLAIYPASQFTTEGL